jgi:uncharacterized Zn finger protein
MTRETIDEKARRYLKGGRVTIEYADADTVRASARGSDAVYFVGYSGGVSRCDCPARGRCAHLVAVGPRGAGGVPQTRLGSGPPSGS